MKNLTRLLVLAVSLPVVGKASTLLTFDDLPIQQYYGTVPNGYGGLQWTEFGIIQPQNYPINPGGYLAGMVSAPNVAFNAYVNADGSTTGSFYVANSLFDLDSAYLTAAWNDGLSVTVQGFVGTTMAYNNTYTVNTTVPTLINFDYIGVDRVDVISFGGTPHGYGGGGTMVAFDNILVNVPEPSGVWLLAVGVATLLIRRPINQMQQTRC